WDIFRSMTLGIVFGALIGAWTASLLSGPALELIIGVFVIVVAVKMLFGFDPKPSRSVPGNTGLRVAGVVIGWVSAIFGIGGGTLTVPYLSRCNIKMQHAIGISAACGLPIALAGALGNFWTGWGNPELPTHSLGFIYLPALIGVILTSVLFARVGANLAHRLNAPLLRRIFAIMLVLIGLRFLLS
ncbi:MAG: sulfite exporter TauE/SafE family protein, partial [Marinobacter sp.]|nr:sulfite exporter TauE/SafE family protein [Marinobacter sp.]